MIALSRRYYFLIYGIYLRFFLHICGKVYASKEVYSFEEIMLRSNEWIIRSYTID